MALFHSDTTARRVTTPGGRTDALSVLDATYAEEKAWIDDAESAFPASELGDDDVTWLLATVDDEPAGVLRLHYDPSLHRYDEYGFVRLEGAEGLDVDAFVRERSIAEIGRFAVLPKYRGRLRVLFWLMRAAGVDTLERGYTHYVTDIFEGEEHSPYAFHTRVLGFRPVAAHETGEMDCLHRRITLVLNLKAAYERLHATKNRLYRFLTEGLDASLQQRLRV